MSNLKLNPKGYLAVASAVLCGVLFSSTALAVGTAADTDIDNFATVDFKVGGFDQPPVDSPTTSFKVDQVIDVTVAEADGADTDVSPAETDAITRFTVTNDGNATQDFNLSIADLIGGGVFGNIDNIDADALTIVIDANGNDVYDVGVDTIATFIDELSSDDTNADPLLDNVVSVFILGDIPNAASGGDAVNVELSATAHEAGAAGLGVVATETGTNDTAGVEIVFSNNTGSAQDSYLVSAAALSVAKSSVVLSDPLGNTAPTALAIPGSIVEYSIAITNTGGTSATQVIISDDIQTELSFENGNYVGTTDVEIVIEGAGTEYCVAEVGGDTNADGCFLDATGESLTVSLPAVPGPYPDGITVGNTAADDQVTVRFQVSIN